MLVRVPRSWLLEFAVPELRSISRKAIEMASATGAGEILERAARGDMRTVPRSIPAAHAIVMAYHRSAVGAVVGPVPTGEVDAGLGESGRKCPAVRIRAGEHVMFGSLALRFRATVDELALFVQRRLPKQQIAVALDVAVEIGHVR